MLNSGAQLKLKYSIVQHRLNGVIDILRRQMN